jgi:enoyl-CoA hydratase
LRRRRSCLDAEAIDQPASFEQTARKAKEIVFSQLDLDKPLICRLNGHATGLGASLPLLSDIVIAAEQSKIGDPHVSGGSSPATVAL